MVQQGAVAFPDFFQTAQEISDLLVLIVLIPGTAAPAQPNLPADKVDRNVVFGMYSGLALLMDVYYPKQPTALA